MRTSDLIAYIAFGSAALGLSAALTYAMARVVRIMAHPTTRSSHSRATPTSGGVAFVLVYLCASLIAQFAFGAVQIEQPKFWGFLAPVSFLAFVSLIDDILQSAFLMKILTQLLCAGALLASGLVVNNAALPFSGEYVPGAAAYFLTFLWIVGFTNAYNFMDGLDGLAAGVGVIAAGFLSLIAAVLGNVFASFHCMLLLTGLTGFLAFNFPPARIFMGDVGSAFLGFTFAALAVAGTASGAGSLPFYIVPLLFFHFIFDTVFTVFRRLLQGERIHEAHRAHLYQLLNRLGYSHRTVSLFHYAVAAAQGTAALATLQMAPDSRPLVFAPFLIFQLAYAGWVLRRARAMRII